MDSGLWITWYDLPADGRDAYLSWLHEAYLPSLLKRPGLLWAAHYATVKRPQPSHVRYADDKSVPTGNDYLLIIGAETANAFFQGQYANGAPGTIHADRSEADRKMLSMRIGERVNIMAETGRVDGQAAKNYQGGMALGPFIQLGSYNCAWQKELEMQAWYSQVRMPAMATTPGGGIRIRKLVSAAGWAKHAILYEFESLEANQRYFALHKNRPDMKPWEDWVANSLVHAPGSANLANRIWPAVLS